MASLGHELKRERELRGISLKDIADSTKISIKFFQALENDHLDEIPGEFYIKGVIRAYARSIGLEEEYAINKYYEDSLFEKETLEKEQKKEKASSSTNEKRMNFFNFIFIFVLIILIFLAFYFISKPQKASTLPQETASLDKQALPPPNPITEAFLEIREENGLNLEISFLQETWIQVYSDGELIPDLNGVKKPGERVKAKAAEEMILHLGNAGGISYFLNGRVGKPLGSSGTVMKNITITLDNYHEFLLHGEDTKKE